MCIRDSYDPDKRNNVIDDIFYKQNEAKLGDTGQDMIKYNNNIYVSDVYKRQHHRPPIQCPSLF